MSFLRPSFVGLTRSLGTVALVLGTVSPQGQVPNRPPAQQVPHIQADWSCGNVYYVATTGTNFNNNLGSFNSPWRTVTHAVTEAQNQTPAGTPITINVRTGTYAAPLETFPIALPARGIKLQAFEPNVVIRGQSGQPVLLVNQNGTLSGACGFTPDTVIRGLTLREGSSGVQIAVGGTPLTTPDRVCVQRCWITENINSGIFLSTGSLRRSQHVIEENEIDHNANAENFGHGIRALFESGDSSYLIRANNIHDNEVGIEITGNAANPDNVKPRIVSNIVRDAEWGISLGNCSSYLVNNTQGYGRPYSTGFPVVGVQLGGTGHHTVVNNIMWNPAEHAVGASFVDDYAPGTTTTEASNWILEQKDPIADYPQFLAQPTDLHLASNSPLIEIGTNSYVLPIINITAGTITVRADVGMDFDGDSRVLDTKSNASEQNASARVEIGADERSAGAMVRLEALPNDADAFGNVHTNGVAKTIGLVLTTQPNFLCVVYFWNPNGADPIDKNNFVDPFGNWRINTDVQIGGGFATGAGLFTMNLTLDPATLGLERQVYVQALTGDASHLTGTITNRLMLELNR